MIRAIEKAYEKTRQWVSEIENGEALTPSRITLFKICGLKHHYRYNLGMKRPPVARMAFGTAGHAAVNTDLEIKRESGDIMRDKILLDLFEDTLSANLQKVDRKREEQPIAKIKDEMLSKGRRLLLEVYRKIAEPRIKPKFVEHRIEYPIELATKNSESKIIKIVNHLDIITKSREIIDHKFRFKPTAQSTVPTLQMVSYALGYEYETGKPPVSVRHDEYVALKTHNKVTPQFMHAIDPQARRALAIDVQTILRAGEAGVFPLPERGKYPCTSKWCEYWGDCAYGGGGPKSAKILPSGQRIALP